jgi:hypothetical protein
MEPRNLSTMFSSKTQSEPYSQGQPLNKNAQVQNSSTQPLLLRDLDRPTPFSHPRDSFDHGPLANLHAEPGRGNALANGATVRHVNQARVDERLVSCWVEDSFCRLYRIQNLRNGGIKQRTKEDK